MPRRMHGRPPGGPSYWLVAEVQERQGAAGYGLPLHVGRDENEALRTARHVAQRGLSYAPAVAVLHVVASQGATLAHEAYRLPTKQPPNHEAMRRRWPWRKRGRI